MQDSSNTETNSRRIALTRRLSGKRFSLMRRGRDRGRSVPGFSIYGSHNFMQSIREMSIDGHHPGGVMRSPLDAQPPLKVKVKIYNLKEITPCSSKKHLRICGIEGTGFFFPEWRQRVPECIRFHRITETTCVMKVSKHSVIAVAALTGSAIEISR
jgi:hypothetical protein